MYTFICKVYWPPALVTCPAMCHKQFNVLNVICESNTNPEYSDTQRRSQNINSV